MLTHFKAIESVKSAQRGNKMGKKIDPGRSRLGKKIGRLEVYTPPVPNWVKIFQMTWPPETQQAVMEGSTARFV